MISKAVFTLGKDFIVAITPAFIIIFGSISLATLIFSSPELAPYLIIGISSGLIGAIILCLGHLFFSSSKIAIPSTQAIFALIGSIVALHICRELRGFHTEEILSTVIAALMIMNITTGFFMWIIGTRKISSFVRYIPYPISAGFLAGTGLLIISGTLKAIIPIPFSIQNMDFIFHPDIIWTWFTPFIYALLSCFLVTRYKHYIILPIMVLIAFGYFYAYLWIYGISLEQALIRGWMMANYSNQSLLLIPSLEIYPSQIHWDIIAKHIPNYLSLALLANINFSLNYSSFELESQKNIDFNHEFKMTGLSNLLIGLFAGQGGFQSNSLSSTSMMFHTKTRGVNFFILIFILLFLFEGTYLINHSPKSIVVFLLLYIGINKTYSGLIEVKQKLCWHDYFIVLTVALAIGLFNILTGIMVGLLLSSCKFIFQYSQLKSLSGILNGSLLKSNVERSACEIDILKKNGHKILIPVFSGFLFFGNAEKSILKIRKKIIDSETNIQFLVLDFSKVSGLGIGFYQSFVRLLQLCNKRHIQVIFVKLPSKYKTEMYQFIKGYVKLTMFMEFPDLDHSLEWCEQHLLKQANYNQLEVLKSPFTSSLLSYFTPVEMKTGEIVFEKNDSSQELYWLVKGTLEVWDHYKTAHQYRLSSIKTGNIVGEMALFMKTPRSSTVVASTDCLIYCLTEENLNRLYQEQPDLGIQFNQYIIQIIGARLLNANYFNSFIQSKVL